MRTAVSLVRDFLMDLDGEEPSTITNETSFVHDLGFDSLDSVELIMFLEDELGVEIFDEQFETVTKVGDLYRVEPLKGRMAE